MTLRLSLAAAAVALALPAFAQQQSLPSFQTPDAPGSTLSEAERSALRSEIRAYLLENPEVILEAIEVLESRRDQAAAQADAELTRRHAEDLYNDGFSFVGGNPDGDITLVEFADYRCGYCKQAHPQVQALIEGDPELRFVLKEFPILGPDSVTAGAMAMAALEIDRERYAELHDALMQHRGQLTESIAYRIAKHVGYDVSELKEMATAPEITERLAETRELAARLGIQGTPAFVVGDRVIRGFLPAAELAAIIAEERAALN